MSRSHINQFMEKKKQSGKTSKFSRRPQGCHGYSAGASLSFPCRGRHRELLSRSWLKVPDVSHDFYWMLARRRVISSSHEHHIGPYGPYSIFMWMLCDLSKKDQALRIMHPGLSYKYLTMFIRVLQGPRTMFQN